MHQQYREFPNKEKVYISLLDSVPMKTKINQREPLWYHDFLYILYVVVKNSAGVLAYIITSFEIVSVILRPRPKLLLKQTNRTTICEKYNLWN